MDEWNRQQRKLSEIRTPLKCIAYICMIVSELYCCEIKFPQSSGWQQLVACLHFFSSRVGAGVISEDLLIFCVVLVGAAQLMLENPGWLRFHDPILGADRQRGRLVFLHVAILYPCPVILPAPVSMLGLLLVPLVWYLCTQSESRSSCIKIYLFGHIVWLQQSQSQATYGLGEGRKICLVIRQICMEGE